VILSTLADVVRKSGLPVEEVTGWQNRGHGPFARVETIVCHHTAGAVSGNMPSLTVVARGRQGLPGPLCNLGLGRDGTVYVVAAGIAWHAGAVSDIRHSNAHSIGIEAEATGTTYWPVVQMDAFARLCRTLCDHYGIPVSRVLGHKEVASPRGRKIDPNFDMVAFRDRVTNASNEKDWFDMATKAELREVMDRAIEAAIPSIVTALLDSPIDVYRGTEAKPTPVKLRLLFREYEQEQDRIKDAVAGVRKLLTSAVATGK
jgi:hypothetical protein